MGAITFRYISIKTGRFNARSEQNGLYLLCRFRLNWKTKWVSILTGWNSSVNSFLRAPAVCLILRQAACRGRRPSLCGRFSLLFVRFSKTRRSIVLAAWGWVQRRGEIRSLNGAEITVAAWISSTSFKGAILIFLYRFLGFRTQHSKCFSKIVPPDSIDKNATFTSLNREDSGLLTQSACWFVALMFGHISSLLFIVALKHQSHTVTKMPQNTGISHKTADGFCCVTIWMLQSALLSSQFSYCLHLLPLGSLSRIFHFFI